MDNLQVKKFSLTHCKKKFKNSGSLEQRSVKELSVKFAWNKKLCYLKEYNPF